MAEDPLADREAPSKLSLAMSHAEKVRRMIEDLSRRGVSEWTAAPPVYRLAWKLGLEVTPPLFASFGSLFIFQGLFFGVVWGIFFNLTMVTSMPLRFRILMAAVAGVFFGLVMAIVLRRMAKKHRLPAWQDYEGATEPPPLPPTELRD